MNVKFYNRINQELRTSYSESIEVSKRTVTLTMNGTRTSFDFEFESRYNAVFLSCQAANGQVVHMWF